MQIKVEVQKDHLQRISKVKKPILAIAELIWNGFDADADCVSVEIINNGLGGLSEIVVTDDGHGINYEEAQMAFGNLGGSRKREGLKSICKKRLLHGRAGKGRFRSFSLGGNVEWITRFKKDDQVFQYSIKGSSSDLGIFDVTDKSIAKEQQTGTIVRITNIERNFGSLQDEKALQELAGYFALYLKQYSHVRLIYSGEQIKGDLVERCSKSYEVAPIILEDKREIRATLDVIEWKVPMERALFLCDEAGFALEKVALGIHVPRYIFTAYLKSAYIRELDETNELLFDELNPVLKCLIDSGKEKIKQHFRGRASEEAALLVEEWKKEEVYPYLSEPKDIIERTERQVFDVCAVNLSAYLPEFDGSDKKNKKITFSLLKHAIETGPEDLKKILESVLNLPREKQEELGRLLSKTTLNAIINAAKVVADRLDFLKGLEVLVFDEESKEALLERKQLHRIIASSTWIFGEEFHLAVDDDSLTEVLKRHNHFLGKETDDLAPVLREDGTKGIVDLMLSKRIPHSSGDIREHLVIELKRPSKVIDNAVLDQVESYAFAVAGDERFKDTNTKWVFWAVSNEINDTARRKANQADRPAGLYYEDKEQKITIWVKTWGQIIEGCEARLKFYREKLEYYADKSSALELLKKNHAKHLPQHLVQVVDKENP